MLGAGRILPEEGMRITISFVPGPRHRIAHRYRRHNLQIGRILRSRDPHPDRTSSAPASLDRADAAVWLQEIQ